MLFNSIDFLLFFPIVCLLYYIVPLKFKSLWLLVVSYVFYMSWNAEYAILLLLVTITTYVGGLLLEKSRISAQGNQKAFGSKAILFFCIFFNLAILFTFKYYGFASDLAVHLFSILGKQLTLPSLDVVLPVGISFYTFQAIGYTIDVYRQDVHAEKSFIRYALFVSFFPQLVAGPIERSRNILKQLSEPKAFDQDSARQGFFIMLWGYFLKIVLADRIALFVDTVYGSYYGYSGCMLMLATVLFSIQIYCDFAGYSTIAVGTAKILGITLTDNFDAPYLSSSVSLFWKRWHISLTSWFRDYLYIPLGGNKKGTLRKYCNIFIVFLISGLWHGADLSFIVWGGINGIYRIAEEITTPMKNKMKTFLRIRKESYLRKTICACFTFILIGFSWIFFRAPDIPSAITVINGIFRNFNVSALSTGEILRCGLSKANFFLLIICILLLLLFDILKRKGCYIPQKISEAVFPVRCPITIVFICFILLFGIWGPEFNPANFIYFQF